MKARWPRRWALNYGYEPVPNFLFLIKKPFSVIPLRGGCGLRVSNSFPLNYEMFRRPLWFQGLRKGSRGFRRPQVRSQGLWALSPFLPPHFSPPHASAQPVTAHLLCDGASSSITTLHSSVRSAGETESQRGKGPGLTVAQQVRAALELRPTGSTSPAFGASTKKGGLESSSPPLEGPGEERSTGARGSVDLGPGRGVSEHLFCGDPRPGAGVQS